MITVSSIMELNYPAISDVHDNIVRMFGNTQVERIKELMQFHGKGTSTIFKFTEEEVFTISSVIGGRFGSTYAVHRFALLAGNFEFIETVQLGSFQHMVESLIGEDTIYPISVLADRIIEDSGEW